MYYAEAIIDGVLCCRLTPDGKWYPLSPEDLTARIVNLKETLSELQADPRMQLDATDLDQIREAFDDYYEANVNDYSGSMTEMMDTIRSVEQTYQRILQIHPYNEGAPEWQFPLEQTRA